MIAPAMPTPRSTGLGLARTASHAYSWTDGQAMVGPYPGVTSVIGIVDKSGPLMGWARRVTAEAAVRHAVELPALVQTGGVDATVSFLTKAAVNETEKARDMGTLVHALAEQVSRGQEVELSDAERPYLEAYQRWVAEFEPTFLAAEEMVISTTYAYGGTFDTVAMIAGEMWMIDYKTSKGTYAETALQLAAYRNADFIGRPGDPRRYAIPAATMFGVLHIRPEGAELIPYDVGPAEFEAFIHARHLYEWRETKAGRVMGQAIGRALRS